MLPRPVFMTMEKVKYQEIIPNRRHFECEKLRGLISVDECAERFDRSTSDPRNPERFCSCKRCPVGAQHKIELTALQAEQLEALPPVIRSVGGGAACVRCGSVGKRIVSRTLCVSCWNREREHLIGRNAKGNVPAAFKPVTPRRVGVMGEDGTPEWRIFPGQNPAEPIARAARQALPMHGQHPARTHWNEQAQRWEYRDSADRTLLVIEDGGQLHYVSVDELHDGEQPAPVTAPTPSLTPELGLLWFGMTSEGQELTSDWHNVAYTCGTCRRGVLQARRRGTLVQCRCSNCIDFASSE